LLWVGGNAVVLDVSTDENRGRNSGQYQMWFFIGVAGASFFGGLFTDLMGFRGGLWLSALLIGGGAVLWLLFLPETRPSQPEKPESVRKSSANDFEWWSVVKAAFPMFVYRFVIAGVIASTTVLWLENLFGTQFAIFGLLIPLATASGLFRAVVTLISIVGAPVAGFWSDKIRKRWPVLGVTSFLGGIGLWLMSLNLLGLGLMGGFLSQISGGSIGSLVPAISGDQVEKSQHGRALGLIYTIGDFGSTLGPPIALGLLNTGAVSLNWIYQGCAVVFIFLGIFSGLQSQRERPLAELKGV